MSDQMESIDSNTQPTKYSNSLGAVEGLVSNVLRSVIEQVSVLELEKKYPEFTHARMTMLIGDEIQCLTPNHGSPSIRGMEEQPASAVKSIGPDNLMPKFMPKQTIDTVRELPEALSRISSKMNSTNRSNLLKRKISQMSPLNSIDRKQNNNKATSLKKNPYANFTSIPVPEQSDPEIIRLRQKSDLELQITERFRRSQEQKEKNRKEKIQSFHSNYQQKGYTFDYGGEAIDSENTEEKLAFLSMRTASRTLGKGFRSFKNFPLNESHEIKGAKTSRRSKQIKSQELLASIDIPMFSPGDTKSFIPESDPNKMKLNEYKKLYGHRFNRFDKNKTSMTIDINEMRDKNNTEDDFFSSKKHLQDSAVLSKNNSSTIRERSRRLALPRLQGKYKVLDRYQQ